MNNIKVISALKTINYKLLLSIFSIMFLPTIYQTVRIYFLGEMPNEWGVNIASQLSWVSLFYEVIQETLILPLFFLLGKSLNNIAEFANKIRSGLLITTGIYFLLFLFVAIFARQLVAFMAQDSKLINATVDYIRLETVASLFSILWRFVMLVFIVIGKNRNIYILLIIHTFLSILFDTFFISELEVSLKLGVNGIAITNITVNIIALIVAIFLLKNENIVVFKQEKLSFYWIKEWFYVGGYSGIESFLRNIVFIIMILRMVNIITEQGNYWIANNFIWQWLLLPSLALADLAKKEIGENANNIRTKTFGYIVLVFIFSFVWLISIPLWKPFLHYVMNVAEYEIVYHIILLQTGFYLTFMFNNSIFDSTFYGVGKTSYMLIQSILINIFYYGIMFISYLKGIFIPSLFSISLMFGMGMMLDFIPTIILYKRLLRTRNIKIDFNFS